MFCHFSLCKPRSQRAKLKIQLGFLDKPDFMMYICRMKKNEQKIEDCGGSKMNWKLSEIEDYLVKSIAKRVINESNPDPEDIEFHTFCDLFNDKSLRDTDRMAENDKYKRDNLSHLEILNIKLLGKELALPKYFWKRDAFHYIFSVKVDDNHRKLTPGDQLVGSEGITFTVVKVLSFSRFVLRTNTSYSNPPFVGQVLIRRV